MKKTFIALVCMVLASGAALAQKTFTLGPKVGIDYTHQWGNNINDESALNYQIGAFLEYRLNNKFSIAPEVVFATHARPKMEWQDWWLSEEPTRDVTTTSQVNYINIPVMLKYYVTQSLSIDLGPQFGFKVYGKSTDKWKDSNGNWKEKHDIGGRNIDVGLGLGATYNFTERFFVQARYTLGLIPISKGGEAKNGNAQLSIGYRFL
jgi:hypothetical protein